MEALLREWEEEAQILTDALKSADPIAALPAIVEELGRRNLASERGDSPSDAAIFSWAAVDSHVALRTQRAERERMRLFRQLTGRGDLADLFYYAYHGFLLRRRRVPAAAADWASLSRLILQVFSRTARKKQKARPPSRTTRLASIAGVVGLAFLLLPGCTSMRIVRHRDPAADRPREIFPQREVHKPERSTPWIVAAPAQVDFDTVLVRDVDLAMRPLSEYLERRKVRAFVVIRDDTILYERYREGYGPSTTSSSFSVAKSVTSALLGRALASGAIRSLDDPVTAYVPGLAGTPAYSGVTLRQLLTMRSGIDQSREPAEETAARGPAGGALGVQGQ